MSDQRRIEFGKRRPVQALAPQPARKRSGHVALLVMGTLAVGGGAYALMPRESCGPATPVTVPPGMAAPALPQATTPCSSSSHGSSGSGGYRRSGYSFFSGDSSSSHSSGSSDAGLGGVTRGGFGGFAHAFGFSGRG